MSTETHTPNAAAAPARFVASLSVFAESTRPAAHTTTPRLAALPSGHYRLELDRQPPVELDQQQDAEPRLLLKLNRHGHDQRLSQTGKNHEHVTRMGHTLESQFPLGMKGWSNTSRFWRAALGIALACGFANVPLRAEYQSPNPVARPAITIIDPPESGFFAKRLDYDGIAIKAPTNVVDEALFAAYARLSMMMTNLPSVRTKLRAAGAELHIIGRDQVTTDLPDWRHDKGKPIAEYNGLTRDQRTRGMGGLHTSCGEENLLKLEKDRYRGRDICVHEFAHNIFGAGVSPAVREKMREQYRRSLDRGLWVGSYAGSNLDEFFAELSMWYFGTHGDLKMKGAKPADGRDGLKAYDPEACALFDDFYSGRMEPSGKASDTSQVGAPTSSGANLAVVATASTSFVSGHETLTALNDGFAPANSNDKTHGAYGNWPQRGAQWVQYEWTQPVSTRQMEVYWFDDHNGVRLPKSSRLQYWDGKAFVTVSNATGLGLVENCFNPTTFPELTTTKLRLEFDSNGDASTGLLEWRVYDSGMSPNFAPSVSAGVDRVVVLPGATHLNGGARDDGRPKSSLVLRWSKDSGPGSVAFADASSAVTTARFSKVGDYVLKLAADDGQLRSSSAVHVRVTASPPARHLDLVWTEPYQISSPFWRPRLKNLIVNWIPHCVRKCEDPEGKDGGIYNFVQAGRKLAGQAGAKHTGAVFANTWVYNTLESMCIAQMFDAQGDAEIAAAQAAMRKTIDDWVPKMLGAQEPDGYIHTQYTIEGHRRWSDKHAHEDYQAGYFIETAIAHHLMTGGKDARMLDAARRLADCWVINIGPAPKRSWYPGHQEMEMALVKLARYLDRNEGPGKGAPYIELAKFLLDSRQGGDEYDQSHMPVTRQYEAVGHAVRALYSYAGMADIAMATGDVDYLSAVQSLWNSIVNRKYYLTGGVGSGETSEGFGGDFSLPNNAYCESCANSGELFFQHKLQMIHHDARYADLAEETLFNAILGDVDLEAQNYTYTNPLDSNKARYKWHVCPCCVGNIPRTLLSLPTWIYTTGEDELYVNQFVGSTVTVDGVAGTSVQLVQSADYPWSGKVALTVNPAASKKFALKIRMPNRQTSDLYTNTPTVSGLISLAVNGKSLKPTVSDGYAVITRTWEAGDRVEWEVPLKVQRVKADSRIVADRGRVALRYGPLIYNVESVDQDVNSILPPTASLSTEWRGDLLGGVLVIKGAFADGQPLLAIPNYARLNRGGRSLVWLKDQ